MLLVSCNNGSSIIIDQDAFNTDVNYVLNTSSRTNPSAFNVNTYYYESNGAYVFTIQMEYKAITLTNVRAIMIPISYMSSIQDKVLPSFGYDKNLTLGPSKDVSALTYPGYNLSFKTSSKDEEFDFFVSYYLNDAKEQLVMRYTNFTQITK
jgi:hypothetical protein